MQTFTLTLLRTLAGVLAAMAVITVFQRIWHVRRELTRPATDL